jgi:hypothetical protein
MGKKIEKRGDNVHELSPSDFLGAWIGNRNQPNSLSTMERGKG